MAAPRTPLSRLRFGAFLIYAPHGTSANAIRSKNFVVRVKNDKGAAIANGVRELCERIHGSELREFLGRDAALVPVPRSNPIKEGALWPARRVCEELVRAGLGKEVVPCLRRTVSVPKSAWAEAQARPGVAEHLASIVAEPVLAAWSRLVVVDDVVTSGTTLLASASCLMATYPSVEVVAFGLIRTMSQATDLETMYVPVVGEIVLEKLRGTVSRRP